ncbi:MAG TPA: hypothetical protein VJM84_01405 [Actinomycetota bacterium]|nr:hypothetical protein [Actinomycetota bacterium]
MTFRTFSKRASLLSLFLGILLASTVAFAWWTASGTGDGAAEALTAQDIDVAATGTVAELYPGKTNASLYVSFHNPNAYPVSLTGITENSVTVDAGHPACPNTVVSLDGAYPQLPIALAADDAAPGGADEFAGPLTNAVSMAGAATPDACQGATFTINLTVSGTSA